MTRFARHQKAQKFRDFLRAGWKFRNEIFDTQHGCNFYTRKVNFYNACDTPELYRFLLHQNTMPESSKRIFIVDDSGIVF